MSFTFELQKALDRYAGVPLVALASLGDRAHSFGDRGRALAAAPKRPRRVLLVKFWGLGNLSMWLPIARAFKERDPEVEVDLLTLESNREFATPCPWIDHVVTLDPAGVPLRSILTLARGLRERRYDLALDGEQFLRLSALLVWFARPAYSVGFATQKQHRHALFDAVVPCTPDRHMLHLFRDLGRAAGLELEERAERFVPRSPAAARRVRDRLAEWRIPSRPLVVLHPGSGDNFIGRRWPIASYARIADLLIARSKAQIVFTGVDAERGLVAAARRRMSGPSVDLSGRSSLLEMIELLALADLVITNDTAPAHFAAALDRPQIAIFGPNSPALYGPLSPRAATLFTGLSCSPCLLNTNAKSSFCTRPVCVTSIDPLSAFSAAVDLLQREATTSRAPIPSTVEPARENPSRWNPAPRNPSRGESSP